jgi:hypothetical protein
MLSATSPPGLIQTETKQQFKVTSESITSAISILSLENAYCGDIAVCVNVSITDDVCIDYGDNVNVIKFTTNVSSPGDQFISLMQSSVFDVGWRSDYDNISSVRIIQPLSNWRSCQSGARYI